MLIRQGSGKWETPSVTSYTDEATLETMLLESPDLLPGSDGSPLTVVSQLYVPDTGPMDLFAVSLFGEITVVEVKLRANPEIRRSVVGQTLAYASGLWRMTYEELDAAFAGRAGKPLVAAVTERAEAIGGDFDPEAFRATMTRNLATGVMRLVIAVDEITDELKRIVEFLNDRTRPELEVLALELGYVAHAGVEILVPTLYGQEAVRRKAAEAPRRRWDEQALLTAVRGYAGSPQVATVLTAVYEHARGHAAYSHWYWGEGQYPSVTAWFHIAGLDVPVWSIYSAPDGNILSVNFDWIHRRRAGLPVPTVARLADRLRQLPGVRALYADLEAKGYKQRPSIKETALAEAGAAEIVLGALDELLDSGAPDPGKAAV